MKWWMILLAVLAVAVLIGAAYFVSRYEVVPHVIMAVAHDTSGNTSTDTITVYTVEER